jgi:glycosyltransferase involved in cell wall biosynthesis
VTELANAIDRLLTDDASREEMYERCVATASRFSWSNVVAQIDHVYRRLVSGRREDLCSDGEI